MPQHSLPVGDQAPTSRSPGTGSNLPVNLLDQDITWGLTEHLSAVPKAGDIFIDSEANILYVCYTDGTWSTVGVAAALEDHNHDGSVTTKLLETNTHESATADKHHALLHTLGSHSTLLHSELTVTEDQHHTKLHEHDLTSYIPFGDDPNIGQSFQP